MKSRAAGAIAFSILTSFIAAGFAPALAEYPEQNVTIIVPFPAGGASDIAGRVTGNKLSERLGKSVLIENRAGANGSLGATAMKAAKPDGYTLLIGSIGVYAINPALYKKLGYDPLKDFDLLSLLVRTPNVLVANPKFPVKDVKELIAHLKANPGKVTFASSGIGSSDHLTAALFWQKTGTTGIHVPYKGGSAAMTDLIGGGVDASFQNLGAASAHITGGRLKAIAVTSDKRVPQFPNVPTMAEAGISGFEVYSWQAVVAPKGLPREVLAKLQAGVIAALNSPDNKARLDAQGFEVVANTSEQFTEFLKGELARWKQVVDTAGIKPD